MRVRCTTFPLGDGLERDMEFVGDLLLRQGQGSALFGYKGSDGFVVDHMVSPGFLVWLGVESIVV